MIRFAWRISGILLIAGGLLSAIGAFLFSGAAPELGHYATIVGLLLEGAGLVFLARGLRGGRSSHWVPWLFAIGGALDIFFAVLVLIGTVLGAWSLIPLVFITLLIIVATMGLFANRAVSRALKWAFAALAVCLVINLFSGRAETLALVGLVYVVIGVLMLIRPRPLS